MQLTRSLLLIVLAIILFVIAFLIAVDAISGNFAAFLAAGLACDAVSRVP